MNHNELIKDTLDFIYNTPELKYSNPFLYDVMDLSNDKSIEDVYNISLLVFSNYNPKIKVPKNTTVDRTIYTDKQNLEIIDNKNIRQLMCIPEVLLDLIKDSIDKDIFDKCSRIFQSVAMGQPITLINAKNHYEVYENVDIDKIVSLDRILLQRCMNDYRFKQEGLMSYIQSTLTNLEK